MSERISPEVMIAVSNRLAQAILQVEGSIIEFLVLGLNHPEGNGWLAICDTNLIAAHQNLQACDHALQDCFIEQARYHASLAATLVHNCRFVTVHCMNFRKQSMPDDYNALIEGADEAFKELCNHLNLLPIQIGEI